MKRALPRRRRSFGSSKLRHQPPPPLPEGRSTALPTISARRGSSPSRTRATPTATTTPPSARRSPTRSATAAPTPASPPRSTDATALPARNATTSPIWITSSPGTTRQVSGASPAPMRPSPISTLKIHRAGTSTAMCATTLWLWSIQRGEMLCGSLTREQAKQRL